MRGNRPCGFGNTLKDAVNIFQHIVVPEPQHEVTHRSKLFGSLSILGYARAVLAAVELDDQARLCTKKIDHIPVKRCLPTEFQIA